MTQDLQGRVAALEGQLKMDLQGRVAALEEELKMTQDLRAGEEELRTAFLNNPKAEDLQDRVARQVRTDLKGRVAALEGQLKMTQDLQGPVAALEGQSQEKTLEQAPEPAAPNASQETPAGTAEPEMPELSSNAVTFTFQLSDGSFKNISFDAKPVGIDFFKTTPMRVKLVAPDSLAEKAGVLPGWVLTHSQGEPLPLGFDAAILKLSLDLFHLKRVR